MTNAIVEAFTAPVLDLYAVSTPTSPYLADSAADMLYGFGITGLEGSAIGNVLDFGDVAIGLSEEDYLWDLYFRIWVIPAVMELRNPRTNVDIPFVIWNAYPWSNTLANVVAEGADGLTLDINIGDVLKAIEYHTVNIQIGSSAPLTIEAVFDFIFSYGGNTFTFRATRASVISIVPEVPLTEKWNWLTDIIVATTGDEQRIGLREVPRLSLEAHLIMNTQADIKARQLQLLFDATAQLVQPFFQYAATLTAPANIGEAAILFDPNRTDLRNGEYVWLYDGESEELNRVATLDGTGATLETPLTVALSAGALVMPAFAGILENRNEIRRKAVHDVAEADLRSLVTQARVGFARPGSAAVIQMFGPYPILDWRPLADEDPNEVYDTGAERIDYDVGAIEIISRWDFTKIEEQRKFLIHRIRKPVQMDWWRDFLDICKGMLNPFLLPTFREDHYVAVMPDDASLIMVLEGSEYASVMFPVETFKRLMIYTAGGVVAKTVVSAVAGEDGNSAITFDVPMPAGDAFRQISHVSYLMKCRLASDEVELEHHGLETILSLSIRTIPE